MHEELSSFRQVKRTVRVTPGGNSTVTLEHAGTEFALGSSAAAIFCQTAEYLLPPAKRPITIAEVSSETGIEYSTLHRLQELLSKNGLLQLAPDEVRSMSGKEFYSYHRNLSNWWLRDVYEHPFWDKLSKGLASDQQVIGYALEKYHYIEGAHEHMGIAAANATPELMPHLARHFIEEYTHGDIYRRGLRSFFTDEQIINSVPLPTTRALLNFLNELAMTNSFSYYSANEVLQLTENSSDHDSAASVDQFHAGMLRYYPFAQPLVRAFSDHTALDQGLDHENVFAEMCESISALTGEMISAALNAARSAVEQLTLFLDGIDSHYGRARTVLRYSIDPVAE